MHSRHNVLHGRRFGVFALLMVFVFTSISFSARVTQASVAEVTPRPGTGSPTLSLQTADETGVVLDVTPPALEETPTSSNGRTFTRLEMAGYGHMNVAGRPNLPEKAVLLALPPGAVPVLTVLETETVEKNGVSVRPAGEQILTNPPDGNISPTYTPAFTTRYAPDAATYGADQLFPAGPAALGDVTWLRDQRVVQVWLRPVQANPARQSLLVHTYLRVRVDFTYPDGPAPAGAASRPESAGYESILQKRILNYQQSQRWRQTPDLATTAPSPCLSTATYRNNAFRVSLTETGMYRLTHADLAAAGLSGTVTASKVRMCHMDQEIAIRVNDGGDGTFGSGDSILFYGKAIKTHDTETNVYTFTYDNGGSDGARIATTSGTGTAASSFYTKTLHLEEDYLYKPPWPMFDDDHPNVTDHWYWDQLAYNISGGTSSLDIPFTWHNNPGGGYMVNVQAEMWGAAHQNLIKFEIKLNGLSVGIATFSGVGTTTRYLFDQEISASALQEGNNTLTLSALDNNPGDPSSNHSFIFNWVELTARRQYVAENDRLAFAQETPGAWQYNLSGFSGNVAAYDVTDSHTPIRIGNATASLLQHTNAAPARYEVTGTTAYRSPAGVAKDENATNLRNTAQQADYIIITDPALAGALSPLIQQRTNQGLTVKTVYVRDIFDEFGYGLYSTQAIVDFLAYAYENWQSPAPTYVLLAGEGSYDHRNILGENGPGDNLVPVYLKSGVDNNLGEAASDNQYVAVMPDSDLPQMLLGRLPASDSSEMALLVDKILTYEGNSSNRAWAGTHFFIADNPLNATADACEPDGAGDFFATVDTFLADTLFPWDNQFTRRAYYLPEQCTEEYDRDGYDPLPPYVLTNPVAMQSKIIEQINAGRQFVIYTGHSSTLQWGKANENFLTATNAQQLSNGDLTSIMLPMTCLEGITHFPLADDQGLSETLLRLDNGGSVASFAPTGLQVQKGHDYLLRGLYDAIFLDGVTTMGAATLAAKMNLYNSTSQFQDLHDTFHLLGDPAMQLQTWTFSAQAHLPLVTRE